MTASVQKLPSASDPPAITQKSLVAKLAAVMAQVERVPKNGWNDFHKYHYATEADITECVRTALASAGVMLIPSVEKNELRTVKNKSGAEEFIATLTVRFTATDGNESIQFNAIGEGQDRGDKATYKAMTGAIKYALLKLFLIPTGDDPEREEGERPQTGARKPPHRTEPKPAPTGNDALRARVADLWQRAGLEWGEDGREKEWRVARVHVFGPGAKVPPTGEWTEAQVDGMEAALFPKPPPADGGDHIPFAPFPNV